MAALKKRKNARKFLFYLFLSLIVISIAIFFYNVFLKEAIFNSLSDIYYQLARFAALLGFFMISFLIISGDTARFFDKYFGIDRIIKVQRKVAIAAYFIVFSHPLFIILSQSYFVKYLVPQFARTSFLFGTLSFYIFIMIMLSSLNYKKISYRIWQYLHAFNYILFFFILYHANYNGSDFKIIQIRVIYIILTLLVVFGMIYRTLYKINQRKIKFFVSEIKRETEDTFTLMIKPSKKICFEPGQFFFLRLENKELYARHPFSASSAPYEDVLTFTMKLAGRFTQEAIRLKPGDEVKIEGPFGKFILNNDCNEYVFIAGGVGITPFMSMIKTIQKEPGKRKVFLLYGSKTKKNMIFKKEIDKISAKWFNKIYVLSADFNKLKEYEHGRINKRILLKYIKKFNNRVFYICGSDAMSSQIIKILRELGVRKENILSESFFW